MSALDTDDSVVMDKAVLAHYHLLQNPFSPQNALFPMPQWKETAEMMIHFTRYSKLIMVIAGIEGIGKSYFKQYFSPQVEANLLIGEINFDPQLNASELPSRIAQTFNIKLTTLQPNLAFDVAAQELLRRLMALEKSALLIIDDAHQWSVDLLTGLFRLYTLDNRFAERLRIILFARPSIKTQLADPALCDLAKSYTHTIVLKSMSPIDTQEYITFCLQTAGWKGDLPFSYTQIRNIYQSTAGVPILVNNTVSQLLIEQATNTSKKQGEFTMPTIMKKYPWQIMSAFAMCVAVASLFLLSGPSEPIHRSAYKIAGVEGTHSMQLLLPGQERSIEEEEMYHMPEMAMALQPINTEGQLLEQGSLGLGGMNVDATAGAIYPEDSHSITLQHGIDPTNESESESEFEVPALTHQLPLVRQKTTLPEMPKETPDPAASAPVPRMTENTLEPVAIVAEATPQKSERIQLPEIRIVPPTESDQSPAIMPSRPLISDADYEKNLLSRAGNRYTIQLAGADTEQALLQFKKENALENQGIIVRTTRNDSDWFVLLYGDYENQHDAVGALRQLPEPLQKLKPQPRQMAGIQEMIKHRRS